MSTTLKIGELAPNFELPDKDGITHTLKEYLGKPIVLYFYPKNDTPGCTKEACSFRDQYADFLDEDVQVIGISSDTVQSHSIFVKKYNLPFVLLSDRDGEIRKQYKAWSMLGLFPSRITYVIDKKGRISFVYKGLLNAEKHVSEALKNIQNAN